MFSEITDCEVCVDEFGCLCLTLHSEMDCGTERNDMNRKAKVVCSYRLSGSVVRLIQAEMKRSGNDATTVVNTCIIDVLGKTPEGRAIILQEQDNDPVRQAEMRALGMLPAKKGKKH